LPNNTLSRYYKVRSAASIRARLLNIARKEQLPFQQILFRFFHERLLARLAQSKYQNSLLLKGGNLIYVAQGNTARPTIDIDFLGKGLANSTDAVLKIIRSICEINLDDQVTFDLDEISVTHINEQNKYHGIRTKVEVGMGTIKQNIQIDIGFGDVVTPKPIELKYPALLPEFPEPLLLAYNYETVIAEKLHAITVLAGFNSRVKDYYDVYIFIKINQLDKKR